MKAFRGCAPGEGGDQHAKHRPAAAGANAARRSLGKRGVWGWSRRGRKSSGGGQQKDTDWDQLSSAIYLSLLGC